MNDVLRWVDDFSRASSFADERSRMQARFVVIGSLLGGLLSLTATITLSVVGTTAQTLQSCVW